MESQVHKESQLHKVIRPIGSGTSHPFLIEVYDETLNRAVAVKSNNPLPVFIGDSSSRDAFGRLRVSEPFTVFDSKQLHDKQPLFWDEVITDVSGSATSIHSTVDAATTMHVDDAGDIVERQTFMRFNYQPGKSQLVFMTGVIGAGVANVTREVGIGDANNGLFFQLSGTTLQFITRKNGSDSIVLQSAWNVDRLDGTGPSGITLDTSKEQIFVFDFEWLGVGRVRCGVVINGTIIYANETNTANVETSVYMSTPVLPLRYAITSTGGAGDLIHNCSTVISEGGVNPTGILRSANIGVTSINLATSGTRYAMIGIRLKTTHLDSQIDLLSIELLTTTSQTTTFRWELLLNPTLTGAAFVFASETNSAVQIAFGDNTQLITDPNIGTEVASGYGAGRISETIELRNALRLGADIANTRDVFAVAITPLSNNQDHVTALGWLEV